MSTLSASGIGPRASRAESDSPSSSSIAMKSSPFGLADLVQLADVGVRHAGGGARLAPEALSRLRIPAGLAHHLDGDPAMEALVGGGIDDPHAAFAELRHHAVVSDRVGHERRGDSTRPDSARWPITVSAGTAEVGVAAPGR